MSIQNLGQRHVYHQVPRVAHDSYLDGVRVFVVSLTAARPALQAYTRAEIIIPWPRSYLQEASSPTRRCREYQSQPSHQRSCRLCDLPVNQM